MNRLAIRMTTLLVAVAATAPAAAQLAETSLLSPVPLTSESWAARGTGKASRLAQDLSAPVPMPATQARALPAGPALKREVTVTGEIVRIGDLVGNAGAVAEVAIFRAPDLGQTGSVPAARVIEAVRPHHILQLDTRGVDEVLVTRASRIITAKDVEARLLRALAGQSDFAGTKDLGISFENEVRPFHIEPNAELTIGRLAYSQATHRFDATLEVPTGGGRRSTLRLLGTLVETSEAVVPLRAIMAGEALKAADVMVERRPKTDGIAIEDVLGLTAKHALKPGQVIRAGDVMKRELVARNETVTIVYEAPGMMLSTRGKALDAGTKGDVINVVNIQSNRTIQGTVTGPGRVNVKAKEHRIGSTTTADAGNPQR
jgi:flagellar basal body P-ring formation protein FlgA